MEHLFVIRHGEYGYDKKLNDEGCAQIENLGRIIRGIVGGMSTRIISSTAPRGIGSAEIIARALHINEIEQNAYLWSGFDGPPDNYVYDLNAGKLMDIVEEGEKGVDALVIVSHLEVVRDLPPYFMKMRWGDMVELDARKKGQCVHLDIAKRNYWLRPD
jgi:phosphohistidine phosphatase SixA